MLTFCVLFFSLRFSYCRDLEYLIVLTTGVQEDSLSDFLFSHFKRNVKRRVVLLELEELFLRVALFVVISVVV